MSQLLIGQGFSICSDYSSVFKSATQPTTTLGESHTIAPQPPLGHHVIPELDETHGFFLSFRKTHRFRFSTVFPCHGFPAFQQLQLGWWAASSPQQLCSSGAPFGPFWVRLLRRLLHGKTTGPWSGDLQGSHCRRSAEAWNISWFRSFFFKWGESFFIPCWITTALCVLGMSWTISSVCLGSAGTSDLW